MPFNALAATPSAWPASPTAGAAVLDAIHRRRSVRTFTPRPVDISTINVLLEAAVQAPTAAHDQHWTFAVVQNAAALRQIADRARDLLRQEYARQAEVGPLDAHATGLAARIADPAFNVLHHAGTLIVIAARPAPRFANADCWLGAGNLMLAAVALGLGTCCVGSALDALGHPDTKRLLQIPGAFTPVVAIVVGYPAEPAAAMPAASHRYPDTVYWR